VGAGGFRRGMNCTPPPAGPRRPRATERTILAKASAESVSDWVFCVPKGSAPPVGASVSSRMRLYT
jgi:hypothetical protein